MCVDPALPLARSAARFQKDFHPFRHSRMDWDYVAVNQENKEMISQHTVQKENVTQTLQCNSVLPT